MPPERRDADLGRVARLYYIDGMSQKEIAVAMKTTRSNVSRMLTAAKERGVVQIRILDFRDNDLERQLLENFGLSEALVARFEPGASSTRRAGELGAGWLVDQLRDGQKLAVSWGRSVQEIVWAVTAERSVDVEIVQLVGGLSPVASSPSGQEIVRELATRLGAHYRYLHAPAVLDRSEAAAALAKDRSIAEALEAARESDLALVGVGAVGHGSSQVILEQMRLSSAEREEFLAADLAGDICGRFFDRQGRAYAGPANDRVVGITLDDLRKIPTVVGVGTGTEKGPALFAALRGGLIDVLCCDVPAARAVLELSRR